MAIENPIKVILERYLLFLRYGAHETDGTQSLEKQDNN
jgi:hypothetical protein